MLAEYFLYILHLRPQSEYTTSRSIIHEALIMIQARGRCTYVSLTRRSVSKCFEGIRLQVIVMIAEAIGAYIIKFYSSLILSSWS